ncbi:MAG: glycosyltransferase family 39 protein [Betaproteobacteria bacterium]|nr:glycosyltransferase family 39 protein [Betaproteobacteria bacterium]
MIPRDLHPGAARNLFLVLAPALLAFRLWLAAVLPVTGDEAYFIWWGKVPDWGFYDHPPMVGWWVALLLQISDAPWVLRLPVVLQPLVLALALASFVRRRDPRVAWLAALLVLLAPASVWNVLITTDTPLVYFSLFSGLAFVRAVRDDAPRWYLLAGVLLGGALLSKYFAGLLALACAAFLVWRPTRPRIMGLALLLQGAAPFVALNLWWNWGHCWANLMFNLYNRHEDAGLSWRTPLLYAAMMLYLLTPAGVWRLWRDRRGRAALGADDSGRALLVVGLVPLALFAVLSPFKTIGMHWVLSFLPFVLAAVALAAPARTHRGLVRTFAGLAAVHVIAIGIVAALPMETWKRLRIYDGIVLTAAAPQLLERLEPWLADYVPATDGYSPSVTMSYNAGRYFAVFGPGSSHARHDDILTDWRRHDGANILVLRRSPPRESDYAPYFREVEYREFELRGARFHVVLGRGFYYAAYREGVLEPVRSRWYAIPAWLPAGPCYFCQRYFPDRSCRAATR